jgi:hypothetical protein
MSDCHSVRASKIILLRVFTVVSIMCHVIKNWSIDNNKLYLYHHWLCCKLLQVLLTVCCQTRTNIHCSHSYHRYMYAVNPSLNEVILMLKLYRVSSHQCFKLLWHMVYISELNYKFIIIRSWSNLHLHLWVSGFKYRIFLGVGFLRYGRVSSRQPKKNFCCNRVFEP